MNNYTILELDHPFHKKISAFEYEKDTFVARRDFRMLVHTLGTTIEADLNITILNPEQYRGVWVYNGDMIPVMSNGDLGLIFRKKQGKEELQPARYLPVTRSMS